VTDQEEWREDQARQWEQDRLPELLALSGLEVPDEDLQVLSESLAAQARRAAPLLDGLSDGSLAWDGPPVLDLSPSWPSASSGGDFSS